VVDHGGAFAAAVTGARHSQVAVERRVAVLERRLWACGCSSGPPRRFAVTDIGALLRSLQGKCWSRRKRRRTRSRSLGAEPLRHGPADLPIALLDVQVGDMLAAFMAQKPRVDVAREATNRRVDVIAEAVDVVAPREAAAACGQRPRDARTGRPRAVPGGEPALLATHGTPQAPADLAPLPSLALGAPQQDYVWQL
jgi:hypothetical protein